MMTTTVPVTFTFGVPRDFAFDREVELRAEVTIHNVSDEPVVVPVDKAIWQDALGDEVAYHLMTDKGRVPVRSSLWDGAEEHAVEAALLEMQRRMREAS